MNSKCRIRFGSKRLLAQLALSFDGHSVKRSYSFCARTRGLRKHCPKNMKCMHDNNARSVKPNEMSRPLRLAASLKPCASGRECWAVCQSCPLLRAPAIGRAFAWDAPPSPPRRSHPQTRLQQTGERPRSRGMELPEHVDCAALVWLVQQHPPVALAVWLRRLACLHCVLDSLQA
jgi:hypothetical protein